MAAVLMASVVGQGQGPGRAHGNHRARSATTVGVGPIPDEGVANCQARARMRGSLGLGSMDPPVGGRIQKNRQARSSATGRKAPKKWRYQFGPACTALTLKCKENGEVYAWWCELLLLLLSLSPSSALSSLSSWPLLLLLLLLLPLPLLLLLLLLGETKTEAPSATTGFWGDCGHQI